MPVVFCDSITDITWQTANSNTFNLIDSIDTWRISISSNLHLLSHFTSILSQEEQERAGRYHHERDRQRFIVSRIALRVLLGKYLVKEPIDIEFTDSVNKKPIVKNTTINGLHYNLSHSGDYILISLSNCSVGVDVEKKDSAFSFKEILPLCFSREETGIIQKEEKQIDLFYLFWTRKEALIKATAKGIDNDLVNVPCIDGTHEVTEEMIGSSNNLAVSSFEIDGQYTCSIAHDPLIQNVLFWDAGDLLKKL